MTWQIHSVTPRHHIRKRLFHILIYIGWLIANMLYIQDPLKDPEESVI